MRRGFPRRPIGGMEMRQQINITLARSASAFVPQPLGTFRHKIAALTDQTVGLIRYLTEHVYVTLETSLCAL